MIANALHFETLAQPELLAVSSSQVLVGLGSLYLGLIGCWAVYWIFFGMSEKKRHASMAALTHQVKKQQRQITNIEKEFSLTIDAFAISHAKAQTLELEVTMLQERIEQLESAQFELEQQVQVIETSTTADAAQAVETVEVAETAAAAEGIESGLPSITLFTPAKGVNQKIDPELGLVYTEEPKEVDDLTEIWGIGAVNQQRLHQHGVYFFAQIAKWNAKQMDAFNGILGFKGRIEREQWVEQANHRIAGDSELPEAA